MKKDKRNIYLQLANLPNPPIGLCNMCQYAVFDCGCSGAMECHHYFFAISENYEEAWAGGDCWGFRPAYNFEDTVDMVGLILQGKRADMSKCNRKMAYS